MEQEERWGVSHYLVFHGCGSRRSQAALLVAVICILIFGAVIEIQFRGTLAETIVVDHKLSFDRDIGGVALVPMQLGVTRIRRNGGETSW